MEEITVKKSDLLRIMQENRTKHHQIVIEAQAGFRQKVIERLDEMLKLASEGKRIDINVGLQMPEDHTEEYDTVIGMLELDINDNVELDIGQYRMYVQDKWGWQRSFTTTNAFYSSTAAQML